MDVFLGLPWFIGPSVDVHAAGGTFVGQATFNGHIAFTNWPREEVGRLLPPDLELADRRSGAPAVHPVAFVFGEQTEGGVIFATMSVPMGVRYYEFAMAIPFVRHRQGSYLHTFVARMYAGYFPATWNGNVYYGLAKQPADLSWQEPIFIVTAANGLLFHAAVEAVGGWVAGPDPGLANFAAMQSAFTLPIVGRKADGRYVCSYFDWHFAHATVRPTRCALSIDAVLIRNLQPRRCYAVPDGAFEVQGMRWRLSWPVRCRF